MAGRRCLDRYGTKKLRDVLQPAIHYAEDGFPVAELTAESWHESEASLKNDEGAAINYLIDGRTPKAGEIFKNPRMAKTLRRIADEGAEVFYEGDIAEKIVRCSEKNGRTVHAQRLCRSSLGLGGADHCQLPRL